ncbi:MAG: DUF5320 domain-containing protein [Sedimentisphaerales bacterium]|nr:DUF5320 domain-containing protein [Sedimentisphaerales bacterium]
MPGFDGTGPQGIGPMTGRGMGFCVLKESKDSSGLTVGLAGIQGKPIINESSSKTERKEVTVMPRGNGTGPAGLGPMTGRAAGFCAGYSVPGYMNPIAGTAGVYGLVRTGLGRYRAGFSGYRAPYYNRGFGFGRGFGRGRGRGCGRFGFWW